MWKCVFILFGVGRHLLIFGQTAAEYALRNADTAQPLWRDKRKYAIQWDK